MDDCYFTVVEGPDSGRKLKLPASGNVRIGRSSTNDLVLTDLELSRNHCLVTIGANGKLTVSDLGSANGTMKNGMDIGGGSVELKVGDRLEIGSTVIIVGSDKLVVGTESGEVDLGLEPKESAIAMEGTVRNRVNLLWAIGALALIIAIAVILLLPREPETVRSAIGAKPVSYREVFYEKVEADTTRIFRYAMSIDEAGMIAVEYDDVPSVDRHVRKSRQMSAAAKTRIAEIFARTGWRELDSEYSGQPVSAENALSLRRVRTVENGKVRSVRVENCIAPEAFDAVCKDLEAFTRNELGIWALEHTAEELMELSAQTERSADVKWTDRDVEHGNLSAAIDLYRESVYYLETVDPKPKGYQELKGKLEQAIRELDERYRAQRFLADKAINLTEWETAQTELRTLLEMVPRKDDARHIEAKAKLVDVEQRLSSAAKGGVR